MKKILFKGVAVAIVTPFKNGEIDFESFAKMIDFQIQNKTDAIVVLGTTGEPATICDRDREEIICFAKRQIDGKAKLVVGAGSNSTRKAIENALVAKKCGADAILVVTPYYNKCTQNGIVQHYQAISQAVDIPIICYNVPSRTGVNITPQTALKLCQIENVVGIKEASGNISQIVELCALVANKMAVYSGDDSLNFVFLCLGAVGAISVTANVLPKQTKMVVDCALKKDFEKAKFWHEKLLEINKNLFVEVNPIPVKYACSVMGLCKNEIRLPLTQLEKCHEEVIKNSLKNLDVEIKNK